MRKYPVYYSKAVQDGELDALKDRPLTKDELADIPRIVRKLERMGLISYKVNVDAEVRGKYADE